MRNLFKLRLDPHRVYGLDILRAIAILLVVIEHGMRLLPKEMNKIIKLVSFDGVSIFFVLSGFLIGGILIRQLEKKPADLGLLKDFWIRRWLRTIPNYLLILVLLVTVYSFTGKESVLSLKSYFIFSQNLYYPHPEFFPEAWSLSVEEWFYLLTPLFIVLAILALKFPPKRAVITAVAAMILLVTCFRLMRYLDLPPGTEAQWNSFFRTQVVTRLDSIMYGLVGAYICFYYPVRWTRYKRPLLYAGLLLFLLAKLAHKTWPATGLFNCVLSFSVNSVATLFLLPFLSELKRGSGFVYRSFTYISLISYSMYLLNLSVIQNCILSHSGWESFTGNMLVNGLLRYLLYWFLTIALSILLYKYFEVPVLKWRDRLAGRKSKTGPEQGTELVVQEQNG